MELGASAAVSAAARRCQLYNTLSRSYPVTQLAKFRDVKPLSRLQALLHRQSWGTRRTKAVFQNAESCT